ncbi:ATP-binding protein [Nitrosopumilus sp. S4]
MDQTSQIKQDEEITRIQALKDLKILDTPVEERFEHLFTTKNDGTGFGLGICKSIINQHQGEITVQNNPTTFTITLPK